MSTVETGAAASPAPRGLSDAVLRRGIALLEEALGQMDVLEERVRENDRRMSRVEARQARSLTAAARAA